MEICFFGKIKKPWAKLSRRSKLRLERKKGDIRRDTSEIQVTVWEYLENLSCKTMENLETDTFLDTYDLPKSLQDSAGLH